MNPPGMVRVLPFSYALVKKEMLFMVSPWTQGRIHRLFDINEQQFPGFKSFVAQILGCPCIKGRIRFP